MQGESVESNRTEELDLVVGDGRGADPLIGTTIADKYEVLSCLGSGGMSTVYKVDNILLNSIMALKLMHQASWHDEKAIRRFQVEAKAISQLVHPNLVTFKDFGITSDGQPYLVLDYLDGVTLTSAIEDSDGLTLPRILDIFEQICNGLAAAHAQKIIHRDIKPDNIMFLSGNQENHIKLVDFGIAKIASEDINQSQQLTRTGEIFGSPLFMSPEQCRGSNVDYRTDIYSLGCVIYTAMTGSPPLVGQSLLETMNLVVSELPEAPTRVRPGLASAARAGWVNVQDIEYVVLRCLEKEPGKRYQSVQEILADIASIRKQDPVHRQALTKSTEVRRLKTIESTLPQSEDRSTLAMLGPVLFVICALTVVGTYFATTMLMPKPAPVEEVEGSRAALPPRESAQDERKGAIMQDGKAYEHFVRGEYRKAIPLLKYGVEVYRQKGAKPMLLADNLNHLGKCYLKLGNYQEAGKAYKEALAIYRKIGPFKGSLQRECLLDYARMQREMKQLDYAQELEREARSLP